MGMHYSNEKNVLRLLAIMKHHGIKKVVASPGAKNVQINGSIQNDKYFEVYSAPDERSAAYIACGLAAESGEPVAITCTGATASRNYLPGLTEAFYRKLPILVITATSHLSNIGQNIPQALDRSTPPKDAVKRTFFIPSIENDDDDWGAVVALNDAMLELRHNGGGPVHINVERTGSSDFSVTELPKTRFIDRISIKDSFPKIPQEKRIAIFVGAHTVWNSELVAQTEKFCELYNAVVLCDHTSNYPGKYKIMASLVAYQSQYTPKCKNIDLMIDMGNISGAYISLRPKEVWRVNLDGVVRDKYKALRYIFEMEELDFFRKYTDQGIKDLSTSYYMDWKKEDDNLRKQIPELPFSNIWASSQLVHKLPNNSVVHLGILNSLRSWNFFNADKSIEFYCNTGGFGIDGPISTALGGALAKKDKLHFLIVGDLAFFYDMNALGNRHFPNNMRILLINNGIGTEFKNYNHQAAVFGDDADDFIAAAGHYGNKSPKLVKHLAEDLNFSYLSASSKEEFTSQIDSFLQPASEKSVIFEIFTDSKKESDALKIMRNLIADNDASTKTMVKQMLGKDNIKKIKHILGR